MAIPTSALKGLEDKFHSCGPEARAFIPLFRLQLSTGNPVVVEEAFRILEFKCFADSLFYLEKNEFKRTLQILDLCLLLYKLFKENGWTELVPPEEYHKRYTACAVAAQGSHNHEAAITYAETSIKIWCKGARAYLIAANSKQKMGDHLNASVFIFRMFRDAAMNFSELDDGLMRAVSNLSCITSTSDMKFLESFCRPHFFDELHRPIWETSVRVLFEEKSFKALAVLTTGNCGTRFEPPTYLHKAADIPGLRYPDIDIGMMLRYLTKEEGSTKAWHLKLAEFLIKRGADVQRIAGEFSQPLLVAITKLSVEGEVPSFMELAWNTVDCQDYDHADREGNTPLHALVKSSNVMESKMAEVSLKILLDRGCLPLLKDKAGWTPQHYIPSWHSIHKLLSGAASSPNLGLVKRIEKIKEQSNEALKNSQLEKALKGYRCAANIAQKFPDKLDSDKAVLYSNMAAVHLLDNKPKAALESAETSLQYNVGYVKSYLRKGHAYVKLQKPEDACYAFRNGFDIAETYSELLKFSMEAASLASKIPQHHLSRVLKEVLLPMLEHTWADVIEKLTLERKWMDIDALICRSELSICNLRQDLQEKFTCGRAQLRTILDSRLCALYHPLATLLFLLALGADLDTLSTSSEDTALHALTRLAVRNDGLMHPIFAQGLLGGYSFTKLDGAGRTLLHMLCMESMAGPQSNNLMQNFDFLLAMKIDLSICDANKKLALDYCLPGSRLYKAIQSKMKRSDVPSKSQPRQPAQSFGKPTSTQETKPGGTDTPNNKSKKSRAQHTAADKKAGQSSAANSESNGANNNSEWLELKSQGNQFYSKQQFRQALDLYEKAISALKSRYRAIDVGMELSEEDSRNLAVLHGNCAECYCQMNNVDLFFENAKQSVNYHGSWYKSHYRAGRAMLMKGRHQLSVKAFINSYNMMTPNEETRDMKISILKFLMDAAWELKKLKKLGTFEAELKQLKPVPCEIWGSVALTYIKKKTEEDWRLAELVFSRIQTTSASQGMEGEDLAIFCFRGLLRSQTWICRMIKWLLDSRASIATLKFDSDDHFLHAALTVVVLSGSAPNKHPEAESLLQNAINHAKLLGQLDWQDRQGNSALHLLAQTKGPCQPMRKLAASLLIENGVHVMLTRRDGKIALDVTNQSDVIHEVVEEATKAECIISNQIPKQGAHNTGQEPRPAQSATQKTGPHQTPGNTYADSSKPNGQMPKQGRQNTTGHRPMHGSGQGDGQPGQNSSQNKNEASKLRECDQCEKALKKAQADQFRSNITPLYQDLVDVAKANHRVDSRHKKFKEESLRIISRLLLRESKQVVPECILNLRVPEFKLLLTYVADKDQWSYLKTMVLSFKKHKGQHTLLRFAQSLQLDRVVKAENMAETEKEDLVKLLVSHGAVDTGQTLNICLKLSLWKLTLTFLDLGFSPTGLTVTEGDTPMHAAIHIALDMEPGNQELLKKLYQLWDKDKEKYSFLDLGCKDKNGNSLMHLVTKCKFSPQALALVERLCGWNCPVDLTDVEGRTPLQYLKPKDRRAEFLRSVAPAAAGAKHKKSTFSERVDTETNVVQLREQAENILSKMPEATIRYEEDGEFEEAWEEDEEEEEEEEEMGDDQDGNENVDEENTDSDNEINEIYSTSDDDEAQNKNSEPDEAEDADTDAIDLKVFDTLLWDIECTEEVVSLLKTKALAAARSARKEGRELRKERIPQDIKNIIVKKLRLLGSGHWRPHLQRKMHGVPDSLQLYKIQLPGGACLLWELAIAFSPRHSQNPDQVLASLEASLEGGSSLQAQRLLSGSGRVYSQIIRVWSVVLKNADIQRKVKWIVRSHNRGKDCIVQKKLKGLPSSQFVGAANSTRNPVLFLEQDSGPQQAKEQDQERNESCDLCPPASARKNEFQILKFFSFSSSLVSAILSNRSIKVDFPFRETDHEYALIHVQSASPILLLGRSGTGKTTCCLYRLWRNFLCYWEPALLAGEPLLPKLSHVTQEDEEGEEEEVTADAADQVHGDDTADSGHSEEEGEGEDTDCDEVEADGASGEICTHIHQLFVTKNPKLCSEVKKNFHKLRHAHEDLREHDTVEKDPLPNTLEKVDELSYPLFLTSRQLLLLLDGSLEEPNFFPRDEDGDLTVNIPGWGTQEDIFTIVPLDPSGDLDSDDDGDDSDDNKDQGARRGKDAEAHHQFGQQRKLKNYLRRECTFEVFANDVWSKIAKKAKMDCHPSLVWTEIMSFIQGSFEALGSDTGYLSEKDYVAVGRKQAPNFSGDRAKVYAAFQLYRKYKQNNQLFDESDLVYHIYQRVKKMTQQPWVLHEIFVDETQDFTQAELALLLCLCQDPNKMFMAGDTAQAIMRGISFRFCDLSSLFHYARQSAMTESGQGSNQGVVKVPDRVHQLRYNYRSHTGILSLASAVLDVLHRFFPESFDQLERDQGMFAGPRPVVIESCSPDDLAMLLTGNHRTTSSHIEFGAHQAILVVNEESKARLPAVLASGIVLTIYEAKGLEFDDVLLYNFFTDSQATKEWRVVTEFLNILVEENSISNGGNLVEIDTAFLDQANRPRPLPFDYDKHKILSSELKQLYTAVTRAKVNVWIFDEEENSRAPMFEYFKARGLVQCMGGDEGDTEKSIIFAHKSSKQQWRRSGDLFMVKKHFALAAKCYREAGSQDKETLAQAYQWAQEGSLLLSRPSEMKLHYVKAGALFAWSGDVHGAAVCFQNAREFGLAALAYKKNGEMEKASQQYLKIRSPEEASLCLEKVFKFRQAISILVDNYLFDRAIDCRSRYHLKLERVKRERGSVPKVFIENCPKESQSEDELCHSAASFHHKNGDHIRAVAAIMRLKSPSDQVIFLEKHGYWEKAAEIHAAEGHKEEAGKLMLKAGNMRKAYKFAEDGGHQELRASVCLAWARRTQKQMQQVQKEMKQTIEAQKSQTDEEQKEEEVPSDWEARATKTEVETKNKEQQTSEKLQERLLSLSEEVERYASKALSVSRENRDKDGQAQACLVLGQLRNDEKLLNDAVEFFRTSRNFIGEVESFHAYFQLIRSSAKKHQVAKVEKKIADGLKAVGKLVQERLVDTPARFYGLDLEYGDTGMRKAVWYPEMAPRCEGILLQGRKNQGYGSCLSVDVDVAITKLGQHLMSKVETWHSYLRAEADQKCLENMHAMDISSVMKQLDMLAIATAADYQWQTGAWSKETRGFLSEEGQKALQSPAMWSTVHSLLDTLVPAGHRPQCSDRQVTWRLVSSLQPLANRTSSDMLKQVLKQVVRFLNHEWKTQGRVGRGKSEDIFKERCKSTDWIVRAALYCSLFKAWDKLDVKREVQALENGLSLEYENYKDWFTKKYKYALYEPTKVNGVMIVEHLGSRFLDCVHHLMIEQNVVDALINFTSWLTILGNRGKLDLMPDLKHLVFWLEVFFSITLYLVGKTSPESKKDKEFYLSSNLLTSVELVNACIRLENKEYWTIQEQATDSGIKCKLDYVLLRQRYLLHFLVGNCKFSKFGLLGEVPRLYKGGKEADSFIAERIVLLSALVVLNIPKDFVPHDSLVLLQMEFAKLQKVAEEFPKEMGSLVTSITKAQTYDEVATATIGYLNKYSSVNETPFLCSCTWQGRESCPYMWKKLAPGNYVTGVPLPSLDVSAADRLPQVSDNFTYPAEQDEEREAELEKGRAEAKRAELLKHKEQQMAASSASAETQQSSQPGLTTLGPAGYLGKHTDSGGQQSSETAAEQSLGSEAERLFQQYSRVTETECDICNCLYRSAAQLEGKEQEHTDMDNIDLSPSSKDAGNPDQSLKAQHVASQEHINKANHFHQFKNVYIKEIHPDLESIKEFMRRATEMLGAAGVGSLAISRLNDNQRRLEDMRNDLCTLRKWEDWRTLRDFLFNLKGIFNSNKDRIEKDIEEKERNLKAEQEHKEKMEDGFTEVEVIDPTDRPVAGPGTSRIWGQGQVPQGVRNGENKAAGPGGLGRGRGRGRGRGYKKPELPPRFQKLKNAQV